QQLAEAFGYRVITGEDLGGGPITPDVMARINACDALVAVVSRDIKKPGRKGLPHSWVISELTHARAQNKRTVALVATEVKIEGPYTENERIALDPRTPTAAFIKLARTLSLWRREDGRTLKVIILPEE